VLERMKLPGVMLIRSPATRGLAGRVELGRDLASYPYPYQRVVKRIADQQSRGENSKTTKQLHRCALFFCAMRGIRYPRGVPNGTSAPLQDKRHHVMWSLNDGLARNSRPVPLRQCTFSPQHPKCAQLPIGSCLFMTAAADHTATQLRNTP
jgi:hypothetical protein